MNHQLLDPKEIGSVKRVKPIKVERASNRPNLKRDVGRLINWIDGNVLPLVALVLLAGLGVKGLITFLPEMNETTQTVAAITAVAILVVKLSARRV